ncbi:hypothetical protein OA44_09525 [Enterobacter cloacae]|nr:hypothetical protein OA44_09525 [Enterobacter cloacae]
MAHDVRKLAKRISREEIKQVHCHHHQRYQRQRHPGLLRTKNKKCLTEARKRKDGPQPNHPPAAFPQTPEILFFDGICTFLPDWRCRFMQTEKQQCHGKHAGDHRDPENGAEIIIPQQHQANGQQRTEKCADSIH